MASQGDQAYVLAYLRSVGMEFNEKDKKGGLPLHWAAYMGCETSASVLLSWGGSINTQDEDGHTPLHLAALSGNSRIVRNLLIKGADRSIIVRNN